MAYVPVPKDLSKIKTKLAFNLTKRQLVCFSGAAAVGLPAYLLSRDSIGFHYNPLPSIKKICQQKR